MYAWGSTINGELGLGGIEDEHVLTPRVLDWYVYFNRKYFKVKLNGWNIVDYRYGKFIY